MANLSGEYDPDAVPGGDFDPIPEGDYMLEITESDVGPTKSGTGKVLKFSTKVIEGEYTGRMIWGNINLVNESAKAMEIGQGQFAALRKAVGVRDPQESEELHFRAFKAKVGIEPAKGDYKAKNVIKKFYFEDDSVPADKAAPKAANDNKKAANDNKPPVEQAATRPWNQKKAA